MCENCKYVDESQSVDDFSNRIDIEFAADQLKNVKVVMGLNKTPVEVVETLDGEIWLLSKEDCEYISKNYEIVFKDGKMSIRKKFTDFEFTWKYPYTWRADSMGVLYNVTLD